MRLPFYLCIFTVIMAGCAASKAPVLSPPSASPPPASPQPYPEREEPPPPRRLTLSQVGPDEEQHLKRQAEARIKGAERTVKQIDAKRLASDQEEVFLTIRSFLSKAKEALAIKDFLRASNLADKAKNLAEELLRNFR